MSQQEEKKQLRSWAIKKRSGLPIVYISQNIIKHLQSWDTYKKAKHILSYLAFGDEIDLTSLHQDKDKLFYVTRTHKAHLSIHALENLEPHPFGYLQPSANSPEINPEIIDLVLVPGLCFDKQGFRLGYGKGYYDKLLPEFKNIHFVGITAEELIIEALPIEPFDVAMTEVVTELGVRRKEEGGKRKG
jgi:5-formyltetrahydrofolate cyclo-ligase